LEALTAKARAVEDRRVHRRLLEDAVAEADGYPNHQVRLLLQLCYALTHAQEFDAARERAHVAVEIAERTGDATLVVLALSMAGRLNVVRGGLELLRRARDLEPAAETVDAYESPTTWLGWWLLANDELDAARRLLVDQHRRAIDDGDERNRTVLTGRSPKSSAGPETTREPAPTPRREPSWQSRATACTHCGSRRTAARLLPRTPATGRPPVPMPSTA